MPRSSRSRSASRRSACCCANMKARTPTGCGRPTPSSASRTSRRASPARSAARWRSWRAIRSLELLKELPRGDQSDAPRACRRRGDDARARRPSANWWSASRSTSAIKSIELSARPTFNKQGRFTGYHGVGSDVTGARQAADRIAHMARHDALTGLPNRLQLLDNLGRGAETGPARGTQCAMLLVDLDRFKTINDSLGHVAGDHLLQQVSRSFETVISDEMTAGRLGGDEFAIVVPDDRKPRRGGAALPRADQRAAGAVPLPRAAGCWSAPASASRSARATATGRGADPQRRSRALPGQGGSGNDIRFYEPGLHARAEERRKIELALHNAMDAGEFSLAYQPVVAAQTRRDHELRGAAALAQSRARPDPARQVHSDRRGNRHARADRRMGAAHAPARRPRAGPRMSASRSTSRPRQLRDPGFIVTLVSALTQAGLAPERLELEVTETRVPRADRHHPEGRSSRSRASA